MPLVSFVIPCYRSQDTITGVVDEIRGTMPGLPEYHYEIVLVNDSSPDSTFEVISALAESDSRITAVDLAKNFGQHAALMAGFHYCSGDIVVCLDDDGQTPADEMDMPFGRAPATRRKAFAVITSSDASELSPANSRSTLTAWMSSTGSPAATSAATPAPVASTASAENVVSGAPAFTVANCQVAPLAPRSDDQLSDAGAPSEERA